MLDQLLLPNELLVRKLEILRVSKLFLEHMDHGISDLWLKMTILKTLTKRRTYGHADCMIKGTVTVSLHEYSKSLRLCPSIG